MWYHGETANGEVFRSLGDFGRIRGFESRAGVLKHSCVLTHFFVLKVCYMLRNFKISTQKLNIYQGIVVFLRFFRSFFGQKSRFSNIFQPNIFQTSFFLFFDSSNDYFQVVRALEKSDEPKITSYEHKRGLNWSKRVHFGLWHVEIQVLNLC